MMYIYITISKVEVDWPGTVCTCRIQIRQAGSPLKIVIVTLEMPLHLTTEMLLQSMLHALHQSLVGMLQFTTNDCQVNNTHQVGVNFPFWSCAKLR